MNTHHLRVILFAGFLFLYLPGCKDRPKHQPVEGVLLADTAVMRSSLEKIRLGDSLYTKALQTLKDEADAVFSERPLSVMTKTQTPPSGDKHDYMSQGPYWWPDPSKRDGLPYIRRDGEVNPEAAGFSDHKNMSKLFQRADVLSKAWYFTREVQYAAKAAEIIRGWFLDESTRMNPHLNYGQAIPGISEGRGIGIIETRGITKVLDAIALIKSSGQWREEDEAGMQAWCREYLNWLRTSQYGKEESVHPNNHGTWYDVQTAVLAIYTGQPEIARELVELAKVRRLEAHIAADGSQPEELARTRSWSYSCMNLWGLMQLARVAEAVGVNLWFYPEGGRSLLATALDYLLPYTTAPETWPHQQITEFRPEALLPHLRLAARKYPDSFYGVVGADLSTGSESAILWE